MTQERIQRLIALIIKQHDETGTARHTNEALRLLESWAKAAEELEGRWVPVGGAPPAHGQLCVFLWQLSEDHTIPTVDRWDDSVGWTEYPHEQWTHYMPLPDPPTT